MADLIQFPQRDEREICELCKHFAVVTVVKGAVTTRCYQNADDIHYVLPTHNCANFERRKP